MIGQPSTLGSDKITILRSSEKRHQTEILPSNKNKKFISSGKIEMSEAPNKAGSFFLRKEPVTFVAFLT